MVSPVPQASCAFVRVQSWDIREAAPARAEQVLGTAWPKTTGSVASGRADILALGPTDWLVVTPNAEGEPLCAALNEAFQGSSFRATDVSSALARIQVSGPAAQAVLAKACALDLHESVFPTGRSARTRFAGMPVVIRHTAPSSFECTVSLSYRTYLLSWLADASLEFQDAVSVA